MTRQFRSAAFSSATVAALGCALSSAAFAAAGCGATKALTVVEEKWQGTGVRKSQDRFTLPGKNGFYFTSGMTIDADGSPRAFHPNPKKGLDDSSHAGHPGNWWGIMTDNGDTNGKPLIQGPNDPAPGYYISTTGLQDTTKEENDPRRYADAEKVPYVVLSGTTEQNFNAVMGDYAVVYNKANKKISLGMYGDEWPTLKVGEASVAVAKELGINADARVGGVESSTIVYLIFPNTRTTPWTAAEPIEQIRAEAQKHFEAWGGLAQLQACVQ
jgi:Fungal chitosanase of glycosyl hydrolase group 75